MTNFGFNWLAKKLCGQNLVRRQSANSTDLNRSDALNLSRNMTRDSQIEIEFLADTNENFWQDLKMTVTAARQRYWRFVTSVHRPTRFAT